MGINNTDELARKARLILESVCDPEVPVLTIADLGLIRDIQALDDGALSVVITPTYSGCPAMNTIEINIRAALQEAGFTHVQVITVLSPAWTTDWMSEAGKNKLRAFGIAPPARAGVDKKALLGERHALQCPHCGSVETEMISQFGSTACKALFRCCNCLEPFDYFKCH